MTVSFVASTSGNSGATSALLANFTSSNSIQDGDTLILWAAAERGIIPTISGITGLTSIIAAADATQMAVNIGYKTAVAATDKNIACAANVSSTRRVIGGCLVYRGGGPVAGVANSMTASAVTGSGVAVSSGPNFTPQANDPMLLDMNFITDQSTPWIGNFVSRTAGWTGRTQEQSSSASSANIQLLQAEKLLSGQNGVLQTGNATTLDITNYRYWGFTLAIYPTGTQLPGQASAGTKYDQLDANLTAAGYPRGSAPSLSISDRERLRLITKTGKPTGAPGSAMADLYVLSGETNRLHKR